MWNQRGSEEHRYRGQQRYRGGSFDEASGIRSRVVNTSYALLKKAREGGAGNRADRDTGHVDHAVRHCINAVRCVHAVMTEHRLVNVVIDPRGGTGEREYEPFSRSKP